MDKITSPEMSVVLVTPDDYRALEKVVEHLRCQTVRDQLEVIIVTPTAAKLKHNESELQDFCQFHVVEVGPIHATGTAMAEGVRQATAPVVAYVEEHSYPEAGWAEALIQAHRRPWAGVGSVLGNANPDTMTSWAHLYSNFGPWVEPAEPIELLTLPSHHSAYKREVLLQFGPSLGRLLETPLVLDNELHARGNKFYLEPAAKSYHVNCSSFPSFLHAEYHGGRLFGAAHAQRESWSVFRKMLYIGCTPLIPLVRLRRVWAEICRTGRQRELLPNILPPLMGGLIAHTLGETVGYIFGPGDAAQQRVTIELTRHRHVVGQDRIKFL